MKTNAIKKLIPSLSYDHPANTFSVELELLLGSRRLITFDQASKVMVARDDNGAVIGMEFPKVEWISSPSVFPSMTKKSWGDYSKTQRSHFASMATSEIESLILKLHSQGCGVEYTVRIRELFLARLNRISDEETPKEIAKAVSKFVFSEWKDGGMNNTPIDESRLQYNFNSKLDQFYVLLETRLGYSRIQHSQGGIVKIVTEAQVTMTDDNGKSFPVLEKKKFSRPLKGVLVWGDMSPSIKDTYRSLVIRLFDDAMKDIFANSELNRYTIHGRELLIQRLRGIKDKECPKAILNAALSAYSDWFKMDKPTLSLFNQDYLMKADKRAKKPVEQEAVKNEEALVRLMDDMIDPDYDDLDC